MLRCKFFFGVACFLVILLPSVSFSEPVAGTNDSGLGQAEEKTKDRINWTLEQIDKHGEETGKKAAKLLGEMSEKRTIKVGNASHEKMPAKHPMLDNDGADPEQKSVEEYKKDSHDVAMNDKTFASCFEDRIVEDKIYKGACEFVCYPNAFKGPEYKEWVILQPDCGVPVLWPPPPEEPWIHTWYYVSEHYYPIYEVRIFPGRAMGSFDVAGRFLGGDVRKDLKLSAVKKGVTGSMKQAVEETLAEVLGPQGAKAKQNLGSDWLPPNYDEMEWKGHDGVLPDDPSQPYSYHSLVYQTNVHRQTTRNRPPAAEAWMGFERDKRCFWSTLDNPAKPVIANASYDPEDKDLIRTAMAAMYSDKVDKEAKEAAVLKGSSDLFSLENLERQGNKLPSQMQGLSPSHRASPGEQKWSWMPEGLKTLGINPQKQKRDYTAYGGDLGPFTSANYNSFHDPLYAAMWQGISFYYLDGRTNFPPNKKEGGLRRSIQLQKFTKRESRMPKGYSGEDPILDDAIVFTHKIQLAYPPLQEGAERLGSWCFRPENIGRIEYPNKEGDLSSMSRVMKKSQYFNIPYNLDTRALDKGFEEGLNYASEVRLIIWVKRVSCYCAECGVDPRNLTPAGCTNLNNGDFEQDNFYGRKPAASLAFARTKMFSRKADLDAAFRNKINELSRTSAEDLTKGIPASTEQFEKSLFARALYGPAFAVIKDETKKLAKSGKAVGAREPAAVGMLKGTGLGTPGIMPGREFSNPEITPPNFNWWGLICAILQPAMMLFQRQELNIHNINMDFQMFRVNSKEFPEGTKSINAEAISLPFNCTSPDNCAYKNNKETSTVADLMQKEQMMSRCELLDSVSGEYRCTQAKQLSAFGRSLQELTGLGCPNGVCSIPLSQASNTQGFAQGSCLNGNCGLLNQQLQGLQAMPQLQGLQGLLGFLGFQGLQGLQGANGMNQMASPTISLICQAINLGSLGSIPGGIPNTLSMLQQGNMLSQLGQQGGFGGIGGLGSILSAIGAGTGLLSNLQNPALASIVMQVLQIALSSIGQAQAGSYNQQNQNNNSQSSIANAKATNTTDTASSVQSQNSSSSDKENKTVTESYEKF